MLLQTYRDQSELAKSKHVVHIVPLITSPLEAIQVVQCLVRQEIFQSNIALRFPVLVSTRNPMEQAKHEKKPI